MIRSAHSRCRPGVRSCLTVAILAWTGAQTPAPASDTTNHLTVRGVERTFIVHVPPSYKAAVPAPVLFMFHGLNSDAAAAASSYYGWKSTADSNGFIVVFPDSLTPPGKNIEFPPGNVIFTNYDGTGKRWDIAHVFATNRCDSQDLDFVLAILDWLCSNYNIRTTHVFATGHSYGAFFSYYCAACLHEQIAAFAEHSGGLQEYTVIPGLWTIWWPIDVPSPPPALAGLLLHSPGDTVVGYSNSVLLRFQMDLAGQTAELITLPDSMGHGWDASRNQQQWDFFLAHAPMIDDDQDGMADPWEAAVGLDPTTPDAQLDPDGDQADNLHEFLADTDPLDPVSVFRLAPAPADNGIVLIRWNSSSNRTYDIMRSTNLSVGFVTVTGGLIGTPPANIWTDHPSGWPAYYRIRGYH